MRVSGKTRQFMCVYVVFYNIKFDISTIQDIFFLWAYIFGISLT